MNKFLVSQVISAILSFLMMICITVLATSICLSLTFFRPGFITERMNDKYYNLALDSLRQTLKDEIAPPSHMPEEVFGELFNVYLIEEDSQESVRAILEGIDYFHDSSQIRKMVMDRFIKYAEENNIDHAETNLEALADICIEEYKRQISVPYLKSFAPIRHMFQEAFTYMILILSFLLILLLFFLFGIHRFKHRALRYCIYSLFASALLMIPIPLFLLIQGAYNKINLSPEHVKMLFTSMISSTLLSLVLCGALIAAVGGGLILVVRSMRYKAIRGGKKY